MIFTFWEGKMPEYIKLCLDTWNFDFVVLDYSNLHEYTEMPVERVKRFTLPQVADCVRVHVLRDNGGIWLDADTISLTGRLPEETVLGDPETRGNSIGMLRSDGHPEMFVEWARFQDRIIEGRGDTKHWAALGNAFTDEYLKEHTEIPIGRIKDRCPEVYMIHGDMSKRERYQRFYFESTYHLADIGQTDILMLHNSWTPEEYKLKSAREVLEAQCTLSNILRETR